MKKFKSFFGKLTKNIFFAALGVGCLVIGFLFLWIGTAKIPDFRSINERKILNSTKIFDRTGETLLYDLHQDVKRTVIPFDAMGVNIKNATVAIEDAEFYQHKGIRLKSIARAFFADVMGGGTTQGGSTITQQVIKNSLLTQEKSISRKFKEWILSIKVEQTLSKDDILAIYLNENPYGGTIYGIKESSQAYFKKDPINLTLSEAAYLAAIPQAPTFYSPYGKNRERLDERKNLVLSREKELGFITDEEYQKAKAEVVTFQPQEPVGIRAPHFVFYIRDYLLKTYGEDTVYTGGLKVITTLNWDLQQKGEKIVKDSALKNEKTLKASNAALVALDPKTGQILTMVGSRDYFDKNIDGEYNVTLANRQPGSSFKPFAYATAFKKGYLPETVVFDVPTEFSTTCSRSKSTCYNPNNYDNAFKGPIAMRSALAESRNVPSVKTLYLAGVSDTIKTAKDMGIHTLTNEAQYGLTLVLGGGEVELLDMTSAYGVFANQGIKIPATGILSVTDKDGNIIEEYQKKEEEVLPKNVALQIADVLSDNKARTPTFGANSPLYFPGRDVAAKTGTTNDNRDAWLVGFTPSMAVGVWSGNNDNSPMLKSSSAISGPLWHTFMAEALKTVPVEEFEDPADVPDYNSIKPVLRGQWQGNDHFFVDTISGKLATEFTPEETRKEYVITNVHDILYWVNRSDPRGPAPTDPNNDSQFHLWEPGVQKWVQQHAGSISYVTEAQKPTETDPIHTVANQPIVTITNPVNSMTYPDNVPLSLSINATGPSQIKKVDYFINDQYIGTGETFPFSFSVTPSTVNGISSSNTLKAVVTDTVYNKGEATMEFSVATN